MAFAQAFPNGFTVYHEQLDLQSDTVAYQCRWD